MNIYKTSIGHNDHYRRSSRAQVPHRSSVNKLKHNSKYLSYSWKLNLNLKFQVFVTLVDFTEKGEKLTNHHKTKIYCWCFIHAKAQDSHYGSVSKQNSEADLNSVNESEGEARMYIGAALLIWKKNISKFVSNRTYNDSITLGLSLSFWSKIYFVIKCVFSNNWSGWSWRIFTLYR